MRNHFALEAEIITIGDEILIGQIADTNSAWMGRHLNAIGVWIHKITSVGDQHGEILQALQSAGSRVPLVFITGGLGPTRDDITKQAICDFFADHLERNAVVYAHVEKLLGTRGIAMNPLNQQQADVPAKATILHNACGTAPGLKMEREGVLYYFMPGVPYEMTTLMKEIILPDIRSRFNLPSILHKTFITQGIGESLLAEKLSDFEDQLPFHLSLAYLPEPGSVKLRLTAVGEDSAALSRDLSEQTIFIRAIVADYLVSENGLKAEVEIGIALTKRRETLALAESCTGGYLSHLITVVPGCSAYYKGGLVAYSNESKIGMLGVRPETLEQFGAVSIQVAEEMALGALRAMRSDYSIAITGIAGPGGGSKDKPVGTVCIAWADKKKVYAERFYFGNHRDRTIQRAASTALAILLKSLRTVNSV